MKYSLGTSTGMIWRYSMKFPRSSISRLRTSTGRNGTAWTKPVAHTTRSAGSVVPSASWAHGLPSRASSRVIVWSRRTLMRPSATASKKPSVASPMAPLTMPSILPRGSSPSCRRPN